MLYKDYIASRKREWIGKQVLYQGEKYTVVDVDYNGMLLINKPAKFTETTAISPLNIER